MASNFDATRSRASSLPEPSRPSAKTILSSFTWYVVAQPTPQYGQSESIGFSSDRGTSGSEMVLLVRAPVGHAATHSPHETQVDSPHRVIEVEADPRGVALARAADDFVALDVVAGTDAAIAEDACLMIEWLFQDTSQG